MPHLHGDRHLPASEPNSCIIIKTSPAASLVLACELGLHPALLSPCSWTSTCPGYSCQHYYQPQGALVSQLGLNCLGVIAAVNPLQKVMRPRTGFSHAAPLYMAVMQEPVRVCVSSAKPLTPM